MTVWRPHPGPQEEFCKAGTWEALYGGAAGPGKTECLVMLATRYVEHPRYRGIILRRTFPQLREIIDRTYRYYPSLGAVYRSTEHRWHFPSGATIELGHMQHLDDRYNYQGREYHFVGFDELTQFLRDQYTYLFSRCRTTIPELRPMVRATCNPGGIGHKWVYARFVKPSQPLVSFLDPVTKLSRVFIPGKIYDNPTLIDNDPLYITRLEGLPEIEKRRLLHGDWDTFEGQVFPINEETHGIEPFDVPPEWNKYMVFDWGFSKPFSCGWYAVDFDGVIYRYREWYGCKDGEDDVGLQMTARDVAKGILAREHEKIKARIADPSIFHTLPRTRRNETFGGNSLAQDFTQEGVVFLKADNERMQGLHQVQRRLQIEEKVNIDTGEIIGGSPQLYVFNDHEHFWRTIPTLRFDPRKTEDVETDKQEDHIYDELRYMCMFKPLKPRIHKTEPTGTFKSERDRYLKAKRMSQRRGISMADAYRRI